MCELLGNGRVNIEESFAGSGLSTPRNRNRGPRVVSSFFRKRPNLIALQGQPLEGLEPPTC